MRAKKLIGCVALMTALLVGCNRSGEKNFHLTTSSTPAGANPHPAGVTFDGVDLSMKSLPCLKGLSRFTEPEPFNLLLHVCGW